MHGLFDEHSIGQTRCYWAILDTEARFRLLGPLLRSHAAQEAEMIRGTLLYDWVHPLDLDELKAGFTALYAKGIHEHIVECRYSRLPRIRRKLGAVDPPYDPTAHLVVQDGNWVHTKLVLSYVTDQAILCFFHVIKDKPEAAAYDERGRAIWSDACGPHPLFMPASAYLSERDRFALIATFASLETLDEANSLVFQCLDSSNGALLLSYPTPGQHVYSVEQYAEWARSSMSSSVTGADGKTGCTRRSSQKHYVSTPGSLILQVESSVWQWGCVTFATLHVFSFSPGVPHPDVVDSTSIGVFNEDSISPLECTRLLERSMPANLRGLPGIEPCSPASDDQRCLVTPSMSHSGTTTPLQDAQPLSPLTPIWSPVAVQSPYAYQRTGSSQVSAAECGFSHSPYFDYGYHLPPPPPQPSPAIDRSAPGSAGSPEIGRGAVSQPRTKSPLTGPRKVASVPPVSPRLKRSEANMQDRSKVCAFCQKNQSPEWRKGPAGARVLCNACGLRYARSISGRKRPKKRDKADADLPSPEDEESPISVEEFVLQ